jgi:hypothetical protein
MKTRKELLQELLGLKGSVAELLEKLSGFGYDSEEPEIIVKPIDIEIILSKCINGFISVANLEEWANAIEIRDDVDFENEELKEFIFELANSEINGAITNERLLEIIGCLKEM